MNAREFFAEVAEDPWRHLLVSMWTQAFADGYARAARDIHEAHTHPQDADRSEILRVAHEHLADSEESARLAMALAAIGPLLPDEATVRRMMEPRP